MTIREALKGFIGMKADPTLIDLALIKTGLDGAEAFTADTPEDKMLAAETFALSRMSVLKSFSEDDVTITYDQSAIQARLAILNPPPPEPEAPKPKITAYSW